MGNSNTTMAKHIARRLIDGDIPKTKIKVVRFTLGHNFSIIRTIAPFTFDEINKTVKMFLRPGRNEQYYYRGIIDNNEQVFLHCEEDMPAFKIWIEEQDLMMPHIIVVVHKESNKTIKK